MRRGTCGCKQARMNTALWVVQAFVALGFLAAGGFKLATPKDKLAEKMPWVKSASALQVKLVGAVEVLGAIGVVVPWATGILPVLTPVAAACLAVVMVGAVVTHVKLKDPPAASAPAVVNLVLSLVVAAGRSGLLG